MADTGWSFGRFEGRTAFREAVQAAVERAASQRWSTMLWSDPDFRDWPLNDRALCEALQAWALGGGRLRMLASDFASLRSQAPRFLQWRQQWDHRFEARASGRHRQAETPTLMMVPGAYLWRAETGRAFVVSADAGERARWSEQIESLWQQSTPGLPATTLGL